MLRSHKLLAALTVASVFALPLVGCGDDTSGTGGGGTTPAGAQPPARPSGASAGDGPGATLATTKIYVGTKTRAGAESPNAWKDFGYDLDGVTTSTDFASHCKPAGGAAPNNVFPDGNDGIDNAFGKVLLPVLKTAASAGGVTDLEAELNGGIADGTFTIILDLSNVGTGANYDPIAAYLGAGKNGVGGTWEIVPELLKPGGTSLADSVVAFPTSYVADNTWVSGDKGTVSLALDIAGFQLALNIRSAVITMDLNADRSAGTNGVIAGVLDTEELLTELKKVIGNLDASLCGSAGDNLLNQVRQASDIMKDGSQSGDTCNGISIGLGFDASQITLGPVAEPATGGGEDPCAAGAGGGAG